VRLVAKASRELFCVLFLRSKFPFFFFRTRGLGRRFFLPGGRMLTLCRVAGASRTFNKSEDTLSTGTACGRNADRRWPPVFFSRDLLKTVPSVLFLLFLIR